MIKEDTFTSYKNATNSSCDWESARRFVQEAAGEVRLATFCRIIPEEHQKVFDYAICNLAEIESAYSERLERSVSSERIGNYSVTYESAANLESRKKAEKKAALYRWLADTGLLYRGC